MYEELVMRLHQRIALTTAGSPLQDDLQKAADAIEELSREYESIAASLNESVELVSKLQSPRWVSVEERLPSPMRAVLVWAPYRRNIFMAYLQGNKWYVWGPDDMCCHNWPEYHAITHWMPLMEPPKEEA